jgi:tetratricopeptide (TPR) repeat protein
VKTIYPNNPFLKQNFALLGNVYFSKGMSIGGKDPKAAISWMEKAVEVDPGNAEYWYNIGGASYTVGDFEKARMAWSKTLQLKPDHAQAKQGMAALPSPAM